MKRLGVLFLLAALLLAAPATAGPPVHRATPWWHYNLTFWAPFDDARSPLRLLRGTGALTFTRAHDATHTATYVHPGTGLVTVADNNQLRIEANGALIEGQRTNSALRSAGMDNSVVWTATGIAVTADQAVAPDGTTTAELLSATGANGTLLNSVTGTATAWTHSVYMKRKAGAGGVQVSADNTTWTTCAINSTTWTRCTDTRTLTAATYYFGIRIVTSGDNVYAWGGQMEAGGAASSYIPTTTAAVTRNKDALLLPASNLSSTVGTLAVEFDFNGSLQYERLLGNAADAGAGQIYIQPFGPTVIPNDGTPRTLNVVTAGNVPQRIGIAWSGTQIKGTTNGGTVAADVFGGNMGFDSSPILGSNTAGGREIFGHLRNLRIWNRAFTDAELQNITR